MSNGHLDWPHNGHLGHLPDVLLFEARRLHSKVRRVEKALDK